MNKRIVLVFTLAFLCLLTVSSSQAVMVEVSLEQLTQDADLIVVGTVESVTSQMIKGKIVSFATITVSSKLKGELEQDQNKIVVKFPGGKVGDMGMKVENGPDYKKGENVIVFLKRVPDELYFLTAGASRGKLIINDGIVVRENISLDQFLARIETIIEAGP